MTKKALLVFNPAAGKGRAARLVPRLKSELGGRDFAVDAVATVVAGEATALARQASRDGCAVVFVLGGDGTIREGAAGLLGSTTLLAPLPCGTTNVLARGLGLPVRALAAARAYDGRHDLLPRRLMDVGSCQGHPFLMMASLGLDAQTMAAVRPAAKHRLGQLAVIFEGIRQLLRGPRESYEVEVDGERLRGSFLAFSNIPQYAGPFRMAPSARFDDGLLDLVVLNEAGRLRTASFIVDVMLGRHLRRRDTSSRSARRFLVHGRGPILGQLDGDAVELELPLTVEIAAERLALLSPGHLPAVTASAAAEL